MRDFKSYGYLAHGHTMSRRARIAVEHDEHPLSYYSQLFGLIPEVAELMLVYMGSHHTSSYFWLTKFYRLPDKDDVDELMRIYNPFHSISFSKEKFIKVMAEHLQKGIVEKGKIIPKKDRPRKRRKRRRFARRKRKKRTLIGD